MKTSISDVVLLELVSQFTVLDRQWQIFWQLEIWKSLMLGQSNSLQSLRHQGRHASSPTLPCVLQCPFYQSTRISVMPRCPAVTHSGMQELQYTSFRGRHKSIVAIRAARTYSNTGERQYTSFRRRYKRFMAITAVRAQSNTREQLHNIVPSSTTTTNRHICPSRTSMLPSPFLPSHYQIELSTTNQVPAGLHEHAAVSIPSHNANVTVSTRNNHSRRHLITSTVSEFSHYTRKRAPS